MDAPKPQRLIAPVARTVVTGIDLIRNPKYNKGLAFSRNERRLLRLEGLLPPVVLTQDIQVQRVIESLNRKPTPLEKYIYLMALQDRNESLFYRVLIDHMADMMPIVYTPTVGQACEEYGHIFRKPRGLFITIQDRGNIQNLLQNWPERDIRAIVVTDGERILGLGDLGAYGMGIPVGKLALYTACAGVDPSKCLPVTIDVGTNNKTLLQDPMYIGLPQNRVRGHEYTDLIHEFIDAVMEWYGPTTLIQFEDFGNPNAFILLEKYREYCCCFNDDIQGTSAVTLAGIYGGMRMTGQHLADLTFLIVGAGEAGIGIADLIVFALCCEAKMSEEQAKKKIFFIDSKGLVTKDRTDLTEHKRKYAQDTQFMSDLTEIIRTHKPHALVGVSAQPGVFTQSAIEAIAACHHNPIIFALSNPTSKAECTAEQAYRWTEGRAIFASGSPFDAFTLGTRTFVPGQGNNAYIFPGLGLGILATGAMHVTDEMFYLAAKTLSTFVTDAGLETHCVYPPLNEIRNVSLHIAVAVAEAVFQHGLATVPKPKDLVAHVKKHVFSPEYASFADQARL
eukprot:GILK01002540.1.p1 GENE.GILK01002540.1~~GILK01002540.1.p1  ORF type:complete len:563 (+),score=89.48 GILK01002540.1:90-1778(+)